MDWSKGAYVAWEAGWLLGKYQQYTRWPNEAELDDWLDGFELGCAELGEHNLWIQQLTAYTAGKVIPLHLINYMDKLKCMNNNVDSD